MTILEINGHDYARWVEDGGYSWSRDDLDSEKTKTGPCAGTKSRKSGT